MKELKTEILNKFWTIYENEGSMQALSWLETLKYYEDYCYNDIENITEKISNLSCNN